MAMSSVERIVPVLAMSPGWFTVSEEFSPLEFLRRVRITRSARAKCAPVTSRK